MIRQIAVIGSGTMGSGIGYLAAVAGYETVVHDVEAAALEAARASIESTLRKGVARGKIAETTARAALDRLQFITDLEPAVRAAALLIEAAPEHYDLKQRLFAPARLFCGPQAILAANPSSIPHTRNTTNAGRPPR